MASVAAQHRVPFLGVRGVSDGQGDPLHLPGVPSQFFVYRQLAGNNAAAVTMAFLHEWKPSLGCLASPLDHASPSTDGAWWMWPHRTMVGWWRVSRRGSLGSP